MSPNNLALVSGAFGLGALTVVGVMALAGALPIGNSTGVPSSSTAVVTYDTDRGDRDDRDNQSRTSSDSVVGSVVTDASPVAIADLQRNTVVTVVGTVEQVTDEDEFLLTDITGTIPVWTGQTFLTVNSGETISVTGLVDDDEPLEIYAQQITRNDGSVVDITGTAN